MRLRSIVALMAMAAPLAAPSQAQDRPTRLTEEDYARAERALGATTQALVTGQPVRPTWLADGRFWYRAQRSAGAEYLIVDPVRKTRVAAFDPSKVAQALSRAADTTIAAAALPAVEISSTPAGLQLAFDVGTRRFRCDPAGLACESAPRARIDRTSVASPDGKQAAFIRNHNLWVRDLGTGQERALTTDGREDYGYATNNAGWVRGPNPVLVWSPDSRRIATFQHDARKAGMMYLVNTAVGHPTLEAWKYPLPGDSAIFTIERVVIDVPSGQLVRFQMPADPHRSTICDHVYCGGTWADVEWFPDGSRVAFVSSSRDHKEARLRIGDATTGAIREVLEERVATQYESGASRPNWRVLSATNEVIWFSERDDWGNLYLYDLTSGSLKHQITRGPGPVLDLLRVDEKERMLYYTAGGREPGRDPYYRHFYRIGFDGKKQELLTPDDGNHEIVLSPDGRFFVDTWSTPQTPPTSVLRDARGRLVMPLEQVDAGRLLASGWKPPIGFTVKARDGKTDLYGLMYRPTRFDSTRKYPVINYLYPGPQSGSVGTRSFGPARADKQAIAELGFIVVELDAMGTPGRSKSFHDAYYGNMGDNGLPDQVAGIQQLGARHSWMDLDRVGIWGHSGGGFAAAGGILRYPDFYKVAVAQAGNHDQRTYEDDWGERYHGLLVRNPDSTTSYDSQANQLLAKQLKGKLLIAHGTMDDNVPPNNTMVLADMLIKANKDFDLLMMPNRRHGFGNEPYMMRRRWDYFVRHLMGAEPPREYEIGARRNLVP